MPKNNSKFARESRREGAVKRQAQYDALTAEQKLTRVTEAPGNSARELARLSQQ